MMLDEQQVQTLLRLKRCEQPPPGYFDRALEELHQRQRAELLRTSGFQIWFEQILSSFNNFRVPRLAYAGAFGVFLFLATLLATGTWIPRAGQLQTSSPAVAQISVTNTPSRFVAENYKLTGLEPANTPAIVPSLQPSDASMPRYILDSRPVSYETQVNF
jgi:hypothetical protein